VKCLITANLICHANSTLRSEQVPW